MADENTTNTPSTIDANILAQDITIEHIASAWDKTVEWCGGVFWTPDTLYQGLMVVGAFIVGGLLYRLIRDPCNTKIEESKLPSQAKRIINSAQKFAFPLISLTILAIANSIAAQMMSIETALAEGVVKVLMAWVFIRLITQFISNNLVRNILATSIWAIAALSIFGVLDQTTQTLDAVGFNIGDFRLSALIVIKSAFSLFVLVSLATFMSGVAERKINQSKSLTPSSRVLINKIVRVALMAFALLIGITSAGIDLSLFAVFGGAIGLGIGFGLQKGISNLFSGMLLLLDKSIEPGDVIELEGGTFGWVQHMAARYTEVVTRDNKSFLIPNEDFITQRVVNWSHGNTLIRLEVKFGVSYKHNPHEIREIATEATKDCHERIVATPQPVCHLTEFGDSSLNFKLRFWIKDAEAGVTNIRGAVMLALWDAFKENNIDIPYPHREVYIHETK